MNAAIEQHDLDLAAIWLNRATSEMQQEPQLLLEKERYLSFKGDYRQSADVGRETIKALHRTGMPWSISAMICCTWKSTTSYST